MLYRAHETIGRHVMSYTEATDAEILASPVVVAALADAVRREREAVVTSLRTATDSLAWPRLMMRGALHGVADAIESGAHHPTEADR